MQLRQGRNWKSAEGSKEIAAQELLDQSSKMTTVNIHPGMIAWAREVWSVGNKVIMYRAQVNHNHPDQKHMYEITNNMFKNPVNADLTGKYHQPSMGTDMEMILTYNKEVCASYLFLHFVKVFCYQLIVQKVVTNVKRILFTFCKYFSSDSSYIL